MTSRTNLTALRPHELQLRIYGEEASDADLVKSIETHGLLERIVVLPDGRIISGHRRWRAALEAGITFDAVIMRDDLTEPHAQARAIVEYNRQRTKTAYQIGQEMKALLWAEKEAAKSRQGTRTDLNIQEIFPGSQARDKVGEHFGVSGRTVEKQVAVVETIERLHRERRTGEARDLTETLNKKSVSAAHIKAVTPNMKPAPPAVKKIFTVDEWQALSDDARKALIQPEEGRATFNKTNDMVDWATWTWNPVTGCLHNCPYCYARDMANRFYKHKFTPVFHIDRLCAPDNMMFRKQYTGTDRNVFTCSMADLFGRWVPQDWIDAILDRMQTHNLWNYLVLTKFPQRLSEQRWPANTWVGATVDVQSRVDLTMKAFRRVKEDSNAAVTWLSLEPLLEPLRFDSLAMFDMVVIGGASKSTKTPAWWPPVRWVIDIMDQAEREGVAVYLKENAVKELPSRRAARDIDRAPSTFFYARNPALGEMPIDFEYDD